MLSAAAGRQVLQWVLAGPPQAADAGLLAGLDPGALDPDSQVDLVVAWTRFTSWVEAQIPPGLAGLVHSTRDTGVEGNLARHEVGIALRLSPSVGYDRVERAMA